MATRVHLNKKKTKNKKRKRKNGRRGGLGHPFFHLFFIYFFKNKFIYLFFNKFIIFLLRWTRVAILLATHGADVVFDGIC
jgi:hypothetical protein